MMWLLISLAIWADGSYTFAPAPSYPPAAYTTERECMKNITVENGVKLTNDQPTVYHAYVCMPTEAWNNFTLQMTR